MFTAGLAFGTSVADQPTIPDQVLLTETNHVLLRGEVSDGSITDLIAKLSGLLEKRARRSYPIYIVLDTPGGSVPAGYRLYEFLKGYTNVHTITITSYSMGAVLVELISGQRLMLETGNIMFHRMAVSNARPTHLDEMEAGLRFFRELENFAMDKVAERTGIPVSDLEKEFNDELYMSGTIAVKRNFVDKLISIKCSKALIAKKSTITIQPIPFLPATEIEVSACPLL